MKTWKTAVLALAGGALIALGGVWACTNLLSTYRASHAKHEVGRVLVLVRALETYRSTHRGYPVASSADQLARVLEDRTIAGQRFDYWSDGGSYTLLTPNYHGANAAAPFIFRNGELVSWPASMPAEEIARWPTVGQRALPAAR